MDLIVAVDRNWGIGKGNDLLYHIPEDMKFFRRMTLGKTVICGKNTLLSFPGGKPLPDRHHLVLTHSDMEENENLTVFHSIEALLEYLKSENKKDVFVIGGGSVYRQLYSLCERAYVTRIDADTIQADVFFPDLSQDPAFDLEDEGEIQISKNGLRYSFLVYKNNAVKDEK